MRQHFIEELPTYDGVGVYALVDDLGRRYIGSSTNVAKRIKAHENAFQSGRCSRKFQAAISAGRTFRVEILEPFPYGITRHELFQAENKWLREYDAVRQGYNSTFSTGGVDVSGSCLTPMSDYVVERPSLTIPRGGQSLFRMPAADSQRIREAAKAANQSVQGYILDAVRERMERESQ